MQYGNDIVIKSKFTSNFHLEKRYLVYLGGSENLRRLTMPLGDGHLIMVT